MSWWSKVDSVRPTLQYRVRLFISYQNSFKNLPKFSKVEFWGMKIDLGLGFSTFSWAEMSIGLFTQISFLN